MTQQYCRLRLYLDQYLRYQSRAVIYNEVRVQPNQGSVLETLSDAVIYLWDDGKVHGKVNLINNFDVNIFIPVLSCTLALFYHLYLHVGANIFYAPL